MGDTVRLLHFADLHIGVENYGRLDPATGLNQRLVDFLQRFDELIEFAEEHEADLVLFAGDAFRSRAPTPTQQREFARRIRRLSELGIPIVLLAGNHDLSVMKRRASSVDIFHTLSVPHVIVATSPELLRIETRHGLVQVAAVPYPFRQRLLSREQYRHLPLPELDRRVTQAAVALVERLCSQLDDGLPSVLLGHFSVDTAELGSERGIMVGRDVTLPISALVDERWDYVALGHIHKHQDLNPSAKPPVVYAGSLERVDFGEEGQPKGFCWVEISTSDDGTRTVKWQHIPLAARRFVTIRLDVRDAADPMEVVRNVVAGHDVRDSVVRLLIKMTAAQEPGLRDADLGTLLAEAFYVQINREVERVVRDRLSGMEPAGLTLEHLLERYLISKGITKEQLPVYLRAASPIFGSEPG